MIIFFIYESLLHLDSKRPNDVFLKNRNVVLLENRALLLFNTQKQYNMKRQVLFLFGNISSRIRNQGVSVETLQQQ